MLKIVCLVLLIIFEIPLAYKFRDAIIKYDFSRQAAIFILMFITALIVAGIYKISLFVLR